jgi:[protein-PII] uridylyltransferase
MRTRLFVVSNLRRLAMPKFNHEFPALEPDHAVAAAPGIAYLAALFHDIAKGRGGDHSELGAVDAEAFCLEQGSGRYEARLVAWLVRNHLICPSPRRRRTSAIRTSFMPSRARWAMRRISDYLYVLTVRRRARHQSEAVEFLEGALFEEFYERTKRALRRGLETPVDQDELIRETQDQAHAQNARHPAQSNRGGLVAVDRSVLPALHARGNRLANQRARGPRPNDDTPVVAIRQLTDRGGTAVLTYTPYRLHSFARTTAVLDQMGSTSWTRG